MKGRNGPIPLYVTFRPIEAVVRGHAVGGGDPVIIIDQSYLGSYKAGDRLPVDPNIFQESVQLPLPDSKPLRAIYQMGLFLCGQSQPELFLFLIRRPNLQANDPNVIGNGLQIDGELSKRASRGKVYLWWSGSKTYPLAIDQVHSNQAALEADLAEGLVRRDRWHRAQSASDPLLKLSLLRPFLIPYGEIHATPYDVWSSSMTMLDEVGKAGPAGIPFLNDLLTFPCYQEDFAPDGWRGFGAQERAMVMMALALQKSRAATAPKEKLSQLRPLFDMPQFQTRGGYDPAGLLGEYIDRGLAAVAEAGPQEALPFLRSLLELPQFQENYSPLLRRGFGHDQRAKIELAISRLSGVEADSEN